MLDLLDENYELKADDFHSIIIPAIAIEAYLLFDCFFNLTTRQHLFTKVGVKYFFFRTQP